MLKQKKTQSRFPSGAIDAHSILASPLRYSFCTLVNNPSLYHGMVDSFRSNGFVSDKTEFLYIDNSDGNKIGAYDGLNYMMSRAKGEYLILCHQDILAVDSEATLLSRLKDLDVVDARWAVAGNAGATINQQILIKITDHAGFNRFQGDLPGQVMALDENLLIVKRSANLGFSADLSGYHMYGADIVTRAETAGYSAWVIDFLVEHKGHGATGQSFADSLIAFEKKYENAFKSRRIRTTVTRTRLGRSNLLDKLRSRIRQQRHISPRNPLNGRVTDFRRIAIWIYEAINGPYYTIDGHKFRIPKNIHYVAKKSFWKKTYEYPERTLVSKYLQIGLPVIELGGAFGVVSRVIRDKIGPDARHVIVEANPALLELCGENANLQQLAGRTLIENVAISYQGTDTIKFSVTEGVHDSRVRSEVNDAGYIEVATTTLAKLLHKHKISGPYTLVCDIEGAEYDLFMNDGKALSLCQCAIVELHPNFFYEEEHRSVASFLKAFGDSGFELVDQIGNVIVGKRCTAMIQTGKSNSVS